MAADYLGDQADHTEFQRLARVALESELTSLLAEQETWPKTTDCDRLDAAFHKLEELGILARQNYWCCQTCGHGSLAEELDQAQKAGKFARGYVFYHEQDTESAVEGFGICLAYGATAGAKGGAIQIAADAVRALSDVGLETSWDGTPEKRVQVKLDWKKRRVPP